jgi:hypothetical protein
MRKATGMPRLIPLAQKQKNNPNEVGQMAKIHLIKRPLSNLGRYVGNLRSAVFVVRCCKQANPFLSVYTKRIKFENFKYFRFQIKHWIDS